MCIIRQMHEPIAPPPRSSGEAPSKDSTPKPGSPRATYQTDEMSSAETLLDMRRPSPPRTQTKAGSTHDEGESAESSTEQTAARRSPGRSSHPAPTFPFQYQPIQTGLPPTQAGLSTSNTSSKDSIMGSSSTPNGAAGPAVAEATAAGMQASYYEQIAAQQRMYPPAYYPMAAGPPPPSNQVLWYTHNVSRPSEANGNPGSMSSSGVGVAGSGALMAREQSVPGGGAMAGMSTSHSFRQEYGTVVKGPRGEERVVTTNPDTGGPIAIKPIRSKQTKEQRARLAANKRVYACPFCGHIFSCSSNLSRHKRVHTGVKPYKCSHCESAFSNSSNRKKHEQKCDKVQPGDRVTLNVPDTNQLYMPQPPGYNGGAAPTTAVFRGFSSSPSCSDSVQSESNTAASGSWGSTAASSPSPASPRRSPSSEPSPPPGSQISDGPRTTHPPGINKTAPMDTTDTMDTTDPDISSSCFVETPIRAAIMCRTISTQTYESSTSTHKSMIE